MTTNGSKVRADLVRASTIGGGLFITLLILWALWHTMFTVTNHEVVALTYPSGSVEFFTQPGIYGQWFGHSQSFEKRKKYNFTEKIQFNDGAYADINGSVQYQIPLDTKSLVKLYQYYPTPDSIESGLVETNLKKAIILTGRTMSSKESYAEKRGDLFTNMEDQVRHGPYQTKTRTVEVTDDLDNSKKKLITVVDFVQDPKGPGGLGRAEPGLIELYNIDISNFNFSVKYDDKVEKQIEALQAQAQQVNQSIAEAKQAEQRAVTAAKNGEAAAAEAKWAQEKINATQQAEREQLLKNAELELKAAQLGKQRAIAEGEGEAEKKRLIMNADGALQQKLDTYKAVQAMWATAYANGPQTVPMFQSGAGGLSNGGLNFFEIMSAKALKDMSLELGVPKGNQAAK